MSLRKNVSISLSPELHAVAQRLLTSGRYGNFSEVIRAALRLLDEREMAFQTHRDAHAVAPSSSGTLGA
jgi:antitoxin ParD1/3/4